MEFKQRGPRVALYSKLIPSSGEFRILIFAAGEEHEPLQGTLAYASLETPPQYEALSYVWGDPTYQMVMTLNGRPFKIGSNLHAVLIALRQADAIRVLWIDAICINQQDLAERSQQVVQMHRIYQCASQVIVWLGRPTEHSEVAMELMASIAVQMRRSAVDDSSSPAQNALDRQIRASLKRLSTITNNTWFHRLWVIQEIVYARYALVMCGRSTISWDDMLVAIESIRNVTRDLVRSDPYFPKGIFGALASGDKSQQLDLMQKLMHSARKMSIMDILHDVSSLCRATDPRDNVFGILNLVAQDEWPFPPDYNMTVVEVYTKVALHIIGQDCHLKLLTVCETGDWPGGDSHLRQEFRQNPKVPDLPSWAPAWNSMRLTVPLPHDYASDSVFSTQLGRSNGDSASGGPLYTISDDKKRLAVQGTILAIVQESLMQNMACKGQSSDFLKKVFVTIPSDVKNVWLYRHLSDFMRQLRPAADSKQNDRGSEQSAIDEMRLITCGIRDAEQTKSNLITSLEYTNFKLGRHTPSQAFFNAVSISLKGRVAFATTCGVFGVGPFAARDGDVVALVKGCHVPLLLRPQRVQCLMIGYCREKHTTFCVECASLDCLEISQIVLTPLRYRLLGETYLNTNMRGPGTMGFIGGSLSPVALELV